MRPLHPTLIFSTILLIFIQTTSSIVPKTKRPFLDLRSNIDDGLLASSDEGVPQAAATPSTSSNVDHQKQQKGVDVEEFGNTASFKILKAHMTSVLDNLDNKLVDNDTKKAIKDGIGKIFDEYEHAGEEDLVQTADLERDNRVRRLPFGKMHRLSHRLIDNMNLEPDALLEVHRAIHYVFSNSFSPKYCYAKFAPDHSGCLLSQGQAGCTKVKRNVTEADKETILNLHNHYRSEVAQGLSDMNGLDAFSPAASMLKLSWDEELAYLAQSWADQCLFQSDCDQCRRTDRMPYIGQNIRRVRGIKTPDYPSNWRVPIGSWFATKRNIKSLSIMDSYTPSDNWGSFTQLVWDYTYLVGCGFSFFKEPGTAENYTQLYVCNYGPAGNVLNTIVYEKGTPCTHCPSGHTCNPDKLCEYHKDEPPAGFLDVAVDDIISTNA